MAQYPDEWVLLIGDRLYAHTKDKDAIWDYWDRAWDERKEDDPEPMVVPPYPKRGAPLPVFRGRGGGVRRPV